MRLLITENFPRELETLTEQSSDGKQLYIHGPFIMTEKKNRNGRIYPRDIMEKAVDAYQKDYIDESRAMGELNHPSRPFVDPAEAAIKIESLEWKGDNVIGKAKVLNTFKGQQVKALLEGGIKLGVSTRGLGDVKEQSGADIVKSFILNAVDVVDKPSGQVCYVNPITESMEWVMENGVWIEKVNQDKAQKLFFEQFERLLASLKTGKR